MLILTIINALPVKQSMKNAFLENHIFTEYNLPIIVLYQSGIRDRAGEQEQGVPGSPEAARAHHCPGGGGLLKIHIRSRH